MASGAALAHLSIDRRRPNRFMIRTGFDGWWSGQEGQRANRCITSLLSRIRRSKGVSGPPGLFTNTELAESQLRVFPIEASRRLRVDVNRSGDHGLDGLDCLFDPSHGLRVSSHIAGGLLDRHNRRCMHWRNRSEQSA